MYQRLFSLLNPLFHNILLRLLGGVHLCPFLFSQGNRVDIEDLPFLFQRSNRLSVTDMNLLMSAVREPVQLADLLSLLGRGDETTERLGRVEAHLHQTASRLNKLQSVQQEFDDYNTPDGRSIAEGKSMEMQALNPALQRPPYPPPAPPKNAGTGKLSGNRPAGSHHPLGSVPAANTVSTAATVHAPPRSQVPLADQPLAVGDARYSTAMKDQIQMQHARMFGAPDPTIYDV